MATLQELLEVDFGVSSTEKVASDNQSDIDALAAELGLFDKTASEEVEVETSSEKLASAEGLDSLYASLFPEDCFSKTAEEVKVAQEQKLGALAYDHMAARWDARMEKLAAEVLSGGATISASTAPEHDGNPHEDPTIAQAQKTNRPANAGDKIDTSPVFTDEIKKMNDARTVGDYQQKHAAIKEAAFRKAYLLSNLEG